MSSVFTSFLQSNNKTLKAREPAPPAMESESKVRSQKIANQAQFLPTEIIVEILLRLPVKSLLRFRCVCKPWLSLISDRQFVKTHLRRLSTIDVGNYSRHRVIIYDGTQKPSYKSCSLNSICSYKYDNNPIEFESLKAPFCYGWIVGSCDGLLCIRSFDCKFYLWNPSSSGEYKSFPYFNVNSHRGFGYYNYTYGFGYDYRTDDYKVVSLMWINSGDYSLHAEVNVYTLRTNSWRRIENYRRGRPSPKNGILVSGALHWLSEDNTDNHLSRVISAFDLATETWTVVAQPSYGDTCNNYNLVLGVLRECLCVLTGNCLKSHIDVWMMKEYGVGNSWIKISSFSYLKDSNDFDCYSHLSTICVSKTEELLLLFDLVVNLYNSKDDTFSSLVIEKFIGKCSQSAIYIESLVSPKLDD